MFNIRKMYGPKLQATQKQTNKQKQKLQDSEALLKDRFRTTLKQAKDLS